MTPSPIRDLAVGVFMIAGFAAIAYLSLSIGGVTVASNQQMDLYATFDQIGGLSPRAQVVIGGVKVGQVEAIDLDGDFRARVKLRVASGLALPEDTSASILTSGVLGDQYIELEPGGLDELLVPGSEIQYTQSAFVLERLLGRVLQNIGGGNQ